MLRVRARARARTHTHTHTHSLVRMFQKYAASIFSRQRRHVPLHLGTNVPNNITSQEAIFIAHNLTSSPIWHTFYRRQLSALTACCVQATVTQSITSLWHISRVSSDGVSSLCHAEGEVSLLCSQLADQSFKCSHYLHPEPDTYIAGIFILLHRAF